MWKFRLYSIFLAFSLGLFSTVDVLYLRWAGCSWPEVGLLVGAFNFTVALSEIPTSLLADIRSPKGAILAGICARGTAFLAFAFASSFFGLVIAEVLAGIGLALTSGAYDTIFVSSLDDRDNGTISSSYADITRFGSVGSALGVILGVVAYQRDPRTVWLLSFGAILVCLVIALRFPQREAQAEIQLRTRDLLTSFGRLTRNPALWMSVISASSGVAPYLLWQHVFGDRSLLTLGVMGLMISAVSAVASHVSKYVPNTRRILIFLLLANVVLVMMLGLAHSLVIQGIAFILHVFTQVLVGVQVYGLFQSTIDDGLRATSTSFSSLGDSLLTSAGSWITGVLMSIGGLGLAMTVSVALYVSLLGCTWRSAALFRDSLK